MSARRGHDLHRASRNPRRAIASLAFCALLAALALTPPARAATVSSIQLIERPDSWDGRTVTFVGEAVGEAMDRGDGTWLHLNDDGYAHASIPHGGEAAGYNSGQAVFAERSLAAAVKVFGDHRHRGDLVEVTGVFNTACTEHGGDMDIHVSELRVLSPGATIIEPLDTRKLALLVLGGAMAALAIAVYMRRRNRI